MTTSNKSLEIAKRHYDEAFAKVEAAKAKLETAKAEFIANGKTKAEAGELANDLFGNDVYVATQAWNVASKIVADIEAEIRAEQADQLGYTG